MVRGTAGNGVDDSLSRVLEHVTVTRYVTPLREGGSLPAIVEADNLGTYVMKFRGAGQGPLALVAEIIAGELARRLGLRVPELVLAELDPRIPGSEPDPEIQDLLRASEGLNLGVDFLPGLGRVRPARLDGRSRIRQRAALVRRAGTEPRPYLAQPELPGLAPRHLAHRSRCRAVVPAQLASTADPKRPSDAAEHVLAGRATELAAAHQALRPLVTASLLDEVTGLVPPAWFGEHGPPGYVSYLLDRAPLVPEVIRT